ncbi:MAG TPA: hypothetical protein VGR28_06775 [Candidatus Thermoplasmatota archaeon]|jgi:hypothetical protein|nr:hypothetical protein [Candidatus Thermoplasmatota archaeon]
MHGTHALALAALLANPALLALPAAADPGAPPLLPLALADGQAAQDLIIGVPAELTLAVASGGVAGSGLQPPADRAVRLNATADSGDAVGIAPNPLVLAAGAAEGRAGLRFTPSRLGALTIHATARWELAGDPAGAEGALAPQTGQAALDLARTVIKDTLALEDLAAGAPDADLDLPLEAILRSAHLVAEPLAWRLEASHIPRNGTEPLRWTAAQGLGLANPDGAAWSATFRARYGPGRYELALAAEGDRLAAAQASLIVEVPEVLTDGGSVPFELEVPDQPTTLRLASDSVNADGKAKTPGNAVITRVVVADGNGLGDVHRVSFAYFRNDSAGRVLVEQHVVEGLGSALQATVEDRFDRAPMKDADYVCVVAAEGSGSPTVERTFVITDVAASANLTLSETSWRPVEPGVLHGALAVLDANFGTGPLDGTDITELAPLHVRLFKGSSQVTEAGWTLQAGALEGAPPLELDLGGEGARTTNLTYQARDGKGELTLPVAVRIPAGAAAGTYRVSVAANSTLSSVPFEVLELPRIAKLAVQAGALPGASANVTVDLQPSDGAVAVELRAPWGAVLRAPVEDLVPLNATALRWNASLPLPEPLDDDASWELTAVADLGDGRVVLDALGQPVNARTAALAVANAHPTLDASLRVGGVGVGAEAWLHPHAAGELTATAQARDANAAFPDLSDEVLPLEAEVRDWRGNLTAWAVEGPRDPAGATLRVLAPADAERGRYTLTVLARDDDGATAEAPLAVNVGTRFRLAVLAPVDGLRFAAQANGSLAAQLEVRNLGNAPAGSLAVIVEGLPDGTAPTAQLRLANGTVLAEPLSAGFARFEAPQLLRPGETASVVVRIATTVGLSPGTFAGSVRIAGEAA